jgi:hypothetical protein
MTNQPSSSSLSQPFSSSSSPSPSQSKKPILLPSVSPNVSGIAAFRNQSLDRTEYSSPCGGGDLCNYDDSIAKRRIYSSPHHSDPPPQSHSQSQPPSFLRNDSNQSNPLTTPPRGRLPTASATLLSQSPSAPLYGRSNQPVFNSPSLGSGRYQVSPMDHQSRKYQSGLAMSPSFPSSPLASENGLFVMLPVPFLILSIPYPPSPPPHPIRAALCTLSSSGCYWSHSYLARCF